MNFTNSPPSDLGFYKLERPDGNITLAELMTDKKGIIRRFRFTDPDLGEHTPKSLAAAGWKFGARIEMEDSLHEFRVDWRMYERAALAAMQGDWAKYGYSKLDASDYEKNAENYRAAAIAFVRVMSRPLPNPYKETPDAT